MQKRLWLQVWFVALTLTQLPFSIGSFAQQARSEGKRKIIQDIRPVYPALARKISLSGTVRLRVTVSPAGYPLDTEQLGGSPVLVKAATEAVSKAKWEAMPAQTKEIIQIKFGANQK